MKHLFFVTVVVVIFSGTTISLKAQTNINIERFGSRDQPKSSPKFIEGIEIVAPATTASIAIPEEKTKFSQSSQSKETRPAIIKSSLIGSIEACTALQFKYSMMMDREVESIANFHLYNFIDQWWSTPYQYGGSDHSGIDCSAFTARLLSEVYGLTVPRTAKDQYNVCEKLAVEDLIEGDLVFFNTHGGISHVGLYLGNNYFVHSSVSGGVTISSLTDEYYGKKFISGGRIIFASTTTEELPLQ